MNAAAATTTTKNNSDNKMSAHSPLVILPGPLEATAYTYCCSM